MSGPPVQPWDRHNQELVANVHPADWRNPEPAPRYHLVVIGAGTAGLVTAAGAAGLGAKVALIERHLMGGDCLNTGCVPSKALIRSARAAAEVRNAARFGVNIAPESMQIDFAAAMERLRGLRAGISKHDSATRFRKLGVDVFLGQASFVDKETIEVGARKLRFRRAVIATGGRPAHPKIRGLSEAGFLTSETVFNLIELPARLAVIGGGPIGCELAQAFHRLGSRVTLFHKHGHLLGREDNDAAAVIQREFAREGIRLVLNAGIECVEQRDRDKVFRLTSGASIGEPEGLVFDQILVAAGRDPNLDGLNLEAASVRSDARHGVRVDDFLRTTNPRVFAAGDVCMRWKFTHAADAAARIVIQNALFAGRKRVSALTIPWCTYTDPEVARVGLNEKEAADNRIAIKTYLQPFEAVDRAVTDGETDGFVKILVNPADNRILGATIVARHAGEMISEISLAMTARLRLTDLSNVIHPYPTCAEAIRKCADACNRDRLTPNVKAILSTWLRLTG
ncbi:MAG: mercuric reductase [Verrucomicrobia subdivision 3 bacterium]|nr:mercuric reductase [Limisphaerales bacterium]